MTDNRVIVAGGGIGGLATALTLRIVHIHPDATAGVDHLHAVDVAAIEGDALGAEDLSTGAAFDAAHGVRKGAMVLATVVAIVHAAATLGTIARFASATTGLVEQAAEALRRHAAGRRHEGDSNEDGCESGKGTGHGLGCECRNETTSVHSWNGAVNPV